MAQDTKGRRKANSIRGHQTVNILKNKIQIIKMHYKEGLYEKYIISLMAILSFQSDYQIVKQTLNNPRCLITPTSKFNITYRRLILLPFIFHFFFLKNRSTTH